MNQRFAGSPANVIRSWPMKAAALLDKSKPAMRIFTAGCLAALLSFASGEVATCDESGLIQMIQPATKWRDDLLSVATMGHDMELHLSNAILLSWPEEGNVTGSNILENSIKPVREYGSWTSVYVLLVVSSVAKLDMFVLLPSVGPRQSSRSPSAPLRSTTIP